ncbi:hypothetical protein [[Clostridium] innocuum]|uniref:hypothetical protein n=1 Tax=Clostridium innocuum TaxID=1522 RepID=UPI001F3AB77F|nr:hypothetical protein [[Clostridium] innocuum]MCR0401705.1 hypothetical protein [[Clostridium] innocuum]
MMNRIRVFTSGALLAFACYCVLFDRNLPFSLPSPVYAAAFLYFSVFPIKDMLSFCNTPCIKVGSLRKIISPGRNQRRDFSRKNAAMTGVLPVQCCSG